MTFSVVLFFCIDVKNRWEYRVNDKRDTLTCSTSVLIPIRMDNTRTFLLRRNDERISQSLVNSFYRRKSSAIQIVERVFVMREEGSIEHIIRF